MEAQGTCSMQSMKAKLGYLHQASLFLLCTFLCAWVPSKPTSSPPLQTQNTESNVLAGVVTLRPPIEGMAYIPAGTFRMGSDDAEALFGLNLCQSEVLNSLCQPSTFEYEKFAHEVTLPAFWIDRTEVTIEQYERCVQRNQCSTFRSAFSDRIRDPKLPMTYVTWDEADHYCKTQNARLPTEAEWEYAARGTAGRRFPWGMLPNRKVANHGQLEIGSFVSFQGILFGVADDSDGYQGLAPVASFPNGATPNGIFDMAGNAAEWVADFWQKQHTDQSITSPKVTNPSDGRVIRGGSYRQPMTSLRNTSRWFADPASRLPDVGFRCARDNVSTFRSAATQGSTP